MGLWVSLVLMDVLRGLATIDSPGELVFAQAGRR